MNGTRRLPRILLLGEQGQLAWELKRTLAPLGEVVSIGRSSQPWSTDLSRPQGAVSLIGALRPDWIVNAAAYTDVDGAERERELAMAVNGVAPGELAEAARHCGALFLHYSTDHVFDGTGSKPYTEESATSPVNYYGFTKREGERNVMATIGAHIILRTSWIYANRGRNFVRRIRELARDREELTVVNDQRGAPTWARHVAEATAQILAGQGLERERWEEVAGIYHVTAAGATTRYAFAQRIVEYLRQQETVAVRDIRPIASHELPAVARRPAYAVLDNAKLRRAFNISLPHWELAFAKFQQAPAERN